MNIIRYFILQNLETFLHYRTETLQWRSQIKLLIFIGSCDVGVSSDAHKSSFILPWHYCVVATTEMRQDNLGN